MKYLGTTSVEMDAVTKKYVDDASSKGNTAYGWGNHANAGYLKTHQDISGKQDKITTSNKLAASLVSGLATVATSGKYSDLSGTPTIPTTLPASDVYAWAKAATKPTYNWGEITNSGADNIAEGTSDVTDNTELLTSYASNNGFADTNAKGLVYRRDAIKMFNYIKGKLPSWATKSSLAASDVPTLNQNTTGNAATATKLATSRTIWGQDFDGSADVSGILTGATGIAKYITDNWTDGNGNAHPWYGYDMRSQNTGVFSSVISDYFGMSLITHFTNISLTGDGKVGINTYAPECALHVNGGHITAKTSTADGIYVQAANSNGSILLYTNVNRGLYDASTNQWIITTDGTNTWMAQGSVGIGTTSPSAKLDVKGGILASNLTLQNQGVIYGRTSATADPEACLFPRWGNDTYLYYNGNGSLNIGLNNQNIFYKFTNDGKLGIGTTSPSTELDVIGVTRTQFVRFYGYESTKPNIGYVGRGGTTNNNLIINATNDVKIWAGGNSRVDINADGNVGIGTTSPSEKLDVNGNILATGNVAAYSDRRLKSNIQDFEYRGALSPKTYIKDGRQEIGFIAQEVRELYPELVMGNETENDFLSLNYGAITAVLAYQTNDHEARIKTLEAENERLKEMIVELQK